MTKKIKMKHEYKYRNGDPARVLCVDAGSSNYPVISVENNGACHSHTEKGVYWDVSTAVCALDLIRIKPKKPLIEMGRQYRYRNGGTASIRCIDSPARIAGINFPVVSIDHEWELHWHKKTGQCLIDIESDFDLMGIK